MIYHWQALVGAIIGAMSPFLLWWLADSLRKRKEYYDNLYYLERLLVDQANTILEAERTIRSFKDTKISELIENIQKNNQNSFSLDYAFFPLFSTMSLGDDIHRISTKSGYIDNKISKLYQISRDIPYIINDVGRQFASMIQLNKDIVLNQKNPPQLQKDQYIDNLKGYKLMLEEYLLDKNFPIYFKVIFQAREAINELRRIGLWKWRLKFDPRYHFFKSKKQYLKAQESLYENIENYFKKNVEEKLLEIENLKAKNLSKT